MIFVFLRFILLWVVITFRFSFFFQICMITCTIDNKVVEEGIIEVVEEEINVVGNDMLMMMKVLVRRKTNLETFMEKDDHFVSAR